MGVGGWENYVLSVGVLRNPEHVGLAGHLVVVRVLGFHTVGHSGWDVVSAFLLGDFSCWGDLADID